jgi:hypothetical protein
LPPQLVVATESPADAALSVLLPAEFEAVRVEEGQLAIVEA